MRLPLLSEKLTGAMNGAIKALAILQSKHPCGVQTVLQIMIECDNRLTAVGEAALRQHSDRSGLPAESGFFVLVA